MSRVHNLPNADNRPNDPPAVWTPEQLARFAKGRAETVKLAQARAAAKTAPVSTWGPEFDGPRVPAGKAVTVVVAAPVAAAPVIDAPTNTNHRLRIAAETPAPITLANAAEIVTFVPDADGKSVLVTRILNSYPWGRKRLTMTLADGRIEYKRLKLAGFKPW